MNNIDEYCKNPSAYSKNYDSNTLKFFDSICDIRTSDSFKNLVGDGEAIGVDIGKMAGYAYKDGKPVGKVLSEAMSNMIKGLFTPEGLAMIGTIEGTKLSLKFLWGRLRKGIVKNIVSGLIEGQMGEISAEMAEEGIQAGASNAGAIMTEISAEVAEEAMEESAALLFIDFIGEAADGAFSLVMLVQMIGMIFDTWDPCNLKEEMKSEMLVQFTDNFNKIFRENALVAYDSMQNAYGQVSFGSKWPVEYTATSQMLPGLLVKEYKSIKTKYISNYLASLRINSDGDPLYQPSPEEVRNSIYLHNLDPSLLRKWEYDMEKVLFDGNLNDSAAIFLQRFWPILLIIAILILIFIFYIIK